MFRNWLNAREAVEAGNSLAETFLLRGRKQGKLQEFLTHAMREMGARKLNFYKRARLANAFKWKLLENGVQAEVATEITQSLLVISTPESTSSEPVDSTAANPEPSSERKLYADAVVKEAQDAFARGSYSEAVRHYTSLVEMQPRNAEARNNLGASLTRLGRYAEAQEQFRKAIARQPNFTAPYVNVATLQISQGLFAEAETYLRRALSAQASDLAARSLLGQVLGLQGRLTDAHTEYEKVLRAAPRNAEALCGVGILKLTEGRFEEAEDLLKRALVVDPQLARAWAALARVRKMLPSDKLWLKRAEQAAGSLSSPVEEADVRFAIGKYFDDLGDYAKAYKSYSRANELLRSIAPPYDRAARTSFVDDILRVYTPELLSTAQSGGSSSTQPIFVIGMMRSGTSLVEQILASHPDVGGAGELDFWNSVVLKHQAQVRQGPLAEKVRQKLAGECLRALALRCPDSKHIVDKTPVNSEYLGIIHSVFPRARFIYLQRDPIDSCLSCYFQPFAAALSHCLDLSDLAHYYSEHARLIAHWRKVLPAGTLLEVPYEELVANQEYWTRKMLDFLGLQWDERCLKFHETQRAVLTASNWQVRQPMYNGSVQRWRNYSKFIGPLRDLKRA